MNPSGPHNSLGVFQKYEYYLKQICDAFPSQIDLEPQDCRLTTLYARVRAAGNAYIFHRYPSELLPAVIDFIPIWTSLKMQCFDNRLCVTAKYNEIITPQVAELTAAPFGRTGEVQYICKIENPSVDQIRALSFLYHTRAFGEIPTLFTGRLPEYDKAKVLYPGVEVVEVNVGEYLML